MKAVKKAITVSFALLVSLLVTSCDKYNYVDELQELGTRVEILEDELLQFNKDLQALHELIVVIEGRGYVTNVIRNSDGTYVIRLNNGKEITLHNGKDGKDGDTSDLHLGIAQADDGNWYWTLNGDWILDSDGDKMRAGAVDGKDGQDGKTNTAVIPQVQINPVTRNWEISTDGGQTWNDTGISADGKNGKNGKNGVDGMDGKDGKDGTDGKDGAPDVFSEIIVSPDGRSITIVLTDGQRFTVPIV